MKEVEHLTDASSHLLGDDFDPAQKRQRIKPARVFHVSFLSLSFPCKYEARAFVVFTFLAIANLNFC